MKPLGDYGDAQERMIMSLKNERLYFVEINGKRQPARFYKEMIALDGGAGFKFRSLSGHASAISLKSVSNIEEIPDSEQETILKCLK